MDKDIKSILKFTAYYIIIANLFWLYFYPNMNLKNSFDAGIFTILLVASGIIGFGLAFLFIPGVVQELLQKKLSGITKFIAFCFCEAIEMLVIFGSGMGWFADPIFRAKTTNLLLAIIK